MKKLLMAITVSGLVFGACSSSKQNTTVEATPQAETTETTETEEVEERTLDPMEVVAEAGKMEYRGAEKRVNDLLTTSLDVRFDWEKRYLYGKATMDFKPYFYPTSILTLDAKGFDINEVAMVTGGSKKALKYEYEGEFITIDLGKEYTRDEQYTIFVDYVAKPDELESGGSAAITSDKGLYFINPDGTEKNKPQQIWTQGETEASSCWFPTIDSPNERTTQEIYMTVQDKYKTLSNGKLMSSKNNGDGTRTDHWKQEIAHAPYLFAMTVGDFAVIRDEWKGKVVDYYVEPEYEAYARKIFPNTPEMIEYFSNLLDYPFPWDKYSQVVVRDYVSGAMENSSAVIFGEFMQGDDRDLIDFDGEDIVAHELFHHWFGDIVTCESWANLPLNEAFATYGESLWLEHKYGKDEMHNHLRQDLSGYLSDAANSGKKDLIRFYYDDKEDMFDGHSYQKGGRVLHMLRNYVGDEAFFKAFNLYLRQNEYEAVEIHHLRLAFEEVTGEDLNWFFNQWFLGAGHPMLDIEYDYDSEVKRSKVTIKQTQDEDVFEIPMAIDLYFGDKVQRENIVMNERQQTFEFDVDGKPDLINVDGDKMLLCEKKDNKSKTAYVHQLKHAPLYLDKYEALYGLQEYQDDPEVQAAMIATLDDSYWATRSRAALNLDWKNKDIKEKAMPRLKELAADEEAGVRNSAYEILASMEDKALIPLFKKGIQDRSYGVMGQAMAGLTKVDKAAGMAEAKKWETSEKDNVIRSLAGIYGESGGNDQFAFFKKQLNEKGGFTKYVLNENLGKLMGNMNNLGQITEGVELLKSSAMDMDEQWWVRLSGARALMDAKSILSERAEADNTGGADVEGIKNIVDKIGEVMKKIKDNETHDRLKMIYSMMG